MAPTIIWISQLVSTRCLSQTSHDTKRPAVSAFHPCPLCLAHQLGAVCMCGRQRYALGVLGCVRLAHACCLRSSPRSFSSLTLILYTLNATGAGGAGGGGSAIYSNGEDNGEASQLLALITHGSRYWHSTMGKWGLLCP